MIKKIIDVDKIGKVLSFGFGDKVLIGALMGFIDNVTPYRCYEYIRDDMELFHWASDEEAQRYKKLAHQAGIKPDDITKERIIEELRKHRPDLLGVIINDPKGDEWLNKQIVTMRNKLGLE